MSVHAVLKAYRDSLIIARILNSQGIEFRKIKSSRTVITPVPDHCLLLHLSRLMGKPTICIGEHKDADQLRGNREADQRLCFRYSDSTIPLLLKSEISSF